MQILPNLKNAIAYSAECLIKFGMVTKPAPWQGIQTGRNMFEVDNVYWRACMPQSIMALQEMVQPDLPWAEDHFQERVAGSPKNPGNEYLNWPHYKDKEFNDKNFKANGRFTHTYMERMWPKYAGAKTDEEFASKEKGYGINMGIWFPYGDLEDVVKLLIKEPFTRQAYLPIWFPEDTGVKHGGRVPCSIGYHFMRKGDDLHIHYMIRACDFIRHFRNDVYLTVRLCQWVLSLLKKEDEAKWDGVSVGIMTMDIIHFHVFEQEKHLIHG